MLVWARRRAASPGFRQGRVGIVVVFLETEGSVFGVRFRTVNKLRRLCLCQSANECG
jgi:hypothetical protein